jgi:hypothetical protein
MWNPSHEGLEGNELVDEGASRHAALNGAVFDRSLPPYNFQVFERSILLSHMVLFRRLSIGLTNHLVKNKPCLE